MRFCPSGKYVKVNLYLFDAQNRWGYECDMFRLRAMYRMYLFDAQNRWGYEFMTNEQIFPLQNCIYSMLRIVGVMRIVIVYASIAYEMYLFDAQNRWGYEATQKSIELGR